MPDSAPPPTQSPNAAPRTSPAKRRRWPWVCGGLLAFVLIIVATVAITIWWIQRPIKPVVLSAEEKKVVDTKLQQMRSAPLAAPDERPTSVPRANSAANSTSSRSYVPGGKELRLTER